MVRRQSWSSCPNLDSLENLCTEGGKKEKKESIQTPCTLRHVALIHVFLLFLLILVVQKRGFKLPQCDRVPHRIKGQELRRVPDQHTLGLQQAKSATKLQSSRPVPGLLVFQVACCVMNIVVFFPPVALNYLMVAYCYYCSNKQMLCFILHLSPLWSN